MNQLGKQLGFESGLFTRNRIGTARAPGMTTCESRQRQITARCRAMRLQGLQGIGRTSRLKSAGRTQPGTQQQAVTLDHADQHAPDHDAPSIKARPCDRAVARANSCCNSSRTAILSAADVALIICLESIAARKRTT